MGALQPLDVSILETYPRPDQALIDRLLADELARAGQKMVALDDDPTGVQTVHDVSVYTDWLVETLANGLGEDNRLFFVLTNSRGFTQAQTVEAHREIARNLVTAARRCGKDFLLISRSDSTLRGHYPLETQTLKEELEALTGVAFDGEVICPFFKEGGRFTLDDVHYVKEGSRLVPAGETEFARDKTFGYRASHLGEWVEEKTGGAYRARDMVSISLDALRATAVDAIEAQLLAVEHFNKIIVNAADTCDIQVFAIALLRALRRGKHFILRSAAGLPRVLGGVTERPLLSRRELVGDGQPRAGVVLIGSHVNRTTRQLEELRRCGSPIELIEFNQHLALVKGGLIGETARVTGLAEAALQRGVSAVVYTRRERLDLDTEDKERQLMIAVEIADALTGVISGLAVRPGFIIAKGGITSSDVGVKALRVRRAIVLGQVRPGIPVWLTGPESKFPGMAYIIFPGNVGEDTTLREVVEMLLG